MEDIGKLVLRVTTAGLILFHGVDKILHGVQFIMRALAGLHLPGFLAYGVFAGEVAAPLLLLAGTWARPAALVVMVNMLMAILLEAYPNAGVVQATGGWGMEAEAFYLLTALVIVLIGPGRYRLGRRPTFESSSTGRT